MAARVQHILKVIPGTLDVIGWGPHRYRSGLESRAHVAISQFLSMGEVTIGSGAGVTQAFDLRLPAGTARALGRALIEAADVADAAAPTSDDPEQP